MLLAEILRVVLAILVVLFIIVEMVASQHNHN